MKTKKNTQNQYIEINSADDSIKQPSSSPLIMMTTQNKPQKIEKCLKRITQKK